MPRGGQIWDEEAKKVDHLLRHQSPILAILKRVSYNLAKTQMMTIAPSFPAWQANLRYQPRKRLRPS